MKKPTTPSEASQALSTDRTPAEILAELQASFAHSAKLLESMERQLAASTLPLIERPIVWVVREDHPKVQGGVGYVIDNSGRRHWVAKTASSLAIVSKAETLEVLRAINDGVLTTAEAMSLGMVLSC